MGMLQKKSLYENLDSLKLQGEEHMIQKAECRLTDRDRSRQEHLCLLQQLPSEENLWQAIIAFQGYPFKTATGLPFQYKLKVGKDGSWNRELLIDRREKSKSLAWSSVRLAFENSKGLSGEVRRPKALGDIRGVSYIYPILWTFGLICVPEKIARKME